MFFISDNLSASVASVNDNVVAGGVGASIANEVDVSALQLLGIAISPHGDHAPP